MLTTFRPKTSTILAFLATVMTLSTVAVAGPRPAVAGSGRWTTHGPVSGSSVFSVAVSPSKPSVVYAGTLFGVYRSANRGASWAATSFSGPYMPVRALAVSRTSPRTAYLGYDTLYRTRDGGAHWDSLNVDERVTSIALHPTRPNTIYAAGDVGVRRSTDGGKTWATLNDGLPQTPGGGVYVNNVVIDPSATDTLYATVGNLFFGGGGVYKSTDGGLHWAVSYQVAGYAQSVALDPSHPQTLYATLGTVGLADGGGVARSRDGGATWTVLSTGLPSDPSIVWSVVIDPIHDGTVYVTTDHDGLFKSVNGGDSWFHADKGLPTSRYLAIDPKQPATLYAGSYSQGVYKTTNGGHSWHQSVQGMPSDTDVAAVAVNPERPSVVLAGSLGVFGSTGGGVAAFRSTSGGNRWALLENGVGFDSLAFAPSDPSVVYGGWIGVYRSGDGGTTWKEMGLPYYVSSVVVDPTDPDTVYAGLFYNHGGIYRSTDGGRHWTEIDTGIVVGPRDQGNLPFVWSLAIDPQTPATLYAATDNGLYKTTDSGDLWVPAGPATALDVRTVAVDPANPQTLYAGTAPDGAGTLVFKSTNGGLLWLPSSSGLPSTGLTPSAMVIDPSHSSRLYIALAGGSSGAGVYASTDGGGTWSSMSDGLPAIDVLSLAVSPDGTTLHAGTNGGGAYDLTRT